MLLLSGVLLQLVAPILFQRVGAGTDLERVRKMLELNQRLCYCSLGITAVGFIVTLLMHSQIFAWLVAPNYRKVSYLLPWMALSGGLFASAQLATLSLLSEATSRILLAPKIGCALLAAALYFAFVWHFGLAGVVVSGLMVSIVYITWVLRLVALKRAFLA
jgi:O-antigen/teichoic acid export membrane protein